MGFINADTIIVGHGLENDLRALQLIHNTILDTAVVFPHFYGLPYRRSLKALVWSYLKRDIQESNWGHDSYEDARACIELMLWKTRKDRAAMSKKLTGKSRSVTSNWAKMYLLPRQVLSELCWFLRCYFCVVLSIRPVSYWVKISNPNTRSCLNFL